MSRIVQEISFQAKLPRKATKSANFVEIRLHYFFTILYNVDMDTMPVYVGDFKKYIVKFNFKWLQLVSLYFEMFFLAIAYWKLMIRVKLCLSNHIYRFRLP